jgi:ABC-type nitrate/sulfonate/bicarbonate transport system substrate-binding protein
MTTPRALSHEPSPRPDTLWFTRCPVPSATGIAVQNGWLEQTFAPYGIAVSSLRHSADRATRESHFTHTLANSFRQGGNAPAIYARSEGRDTVVIGLQWTPQYEGVLTLPGSGIRSVGDLAGRRLALPRRLNDKIDFWRSIALQGYHNALATAGLTLDDVTLVDLPVVASFVDADPGAKEAFGPARLVRQHQAELAALLRGDVDVLFAYSVWGVALREQVEAVEIINLAREADPARRINNGQPKTLTVSGGLLREHPDVVDDYLATLVRAGEWAAAHPDAARRAIALETGSAEHWLDEGTVPDIAARLSISLDAPLVDALTVRKDFLRRHGFIANDVDIAAWIDPRPLERVRARFAIAA